MPTLADIYSAADSFKRRLSDAASNPSGALSQMLGYANDRARNFNELNRQAADEAIASRNPFVNGPANQALDRALIDAGMMGMTAPAFKTGEAISFPFIKNTVRAPKLSKFSEDHFAQAIEPHGNYVTSAHDVDVSKLPQGWTSGQMEFKNPLVIDWGESGLYSEPDNWKRVLSKQYGGKKGQSLSKAIAREGYDGIVTIKDNQPSEIVDLSRFVAGK